MKKKYHKQKTSKGHSEDRANVAGGQDYEVNYKKVIEQEQWSSKQSDKDYGNSKKKVATKLWKMSRSFERLSFFEFINTPGNLYLNIGTIILM